jgi:hypothetical protein
LTHAIIIISYTRMWKEEWVRKNGDKSENTERVGRNIRREIR